MPVTNEKNCRTIKNAYYKFTLVFLNAYYLSKFFLISISLRSQISDRQTKKKGLT